MQQQTNNQPPFVAQFNERIQASYELASIARDSDLQRQAVENLASLLVEVQAEKKVAIDAQNENYANFLLGCQCVTNAISAELRMWLLLKDERPEAAWDELIAAQMAAIDAVKAHGNFGQFAQYNARLETIEEVVFPPQVFLSSGMIVRRQECSICGTEYEDCEHLVGKPYMGEFCHIIAHDFEADHLAIVDVPSDKRCRVIEFGVEGGKRNKMTWRVTPSEDKSEKPAEGQGLSATGRIMRL